MKSINSDYLRQLLKKELVARCKRNQAYSLRAFARDLRINHSTLSKILSNNRAIGFQSANKILDRITFKTEELKRLYKEEGLESGSKNTDNYATIDPGAYDIISNWRYYAFLELIYTHDFQSDVSWIAKALRTSSFEVQSIIETCVQAQLIQINEKGEIEDISGGKSTDARVGLKTMAQRKKQKELLEEAIRCIETVPEDFRSNSSITFAISLNRIEEAREEIKNFRRNMAKFFVEDEKKEAVYNLSIALFPLSKTDKI